MKGGNTSAPPPPPPPETNKPTKPVWRRRTHARRLTGAAVRTRIARMQRFDEPLTKFGTAPAWNQA